MATQKKPKKTPQPPRRKQEERSATARAKLISSAITLFCERGFSRTATADIASLAGLTRGAIQHHFASRQELVTSILLDVEARVIESFSAAAPKPNVGIEERIDILIDGLSKVSQSQVYLAAMDIWFTSRSDPELSEVVVQSVSRYTDHFRKLWQNTFGDEVPENVITDCRRITVAVSRGLVFSRLIAPDNSSRSINQTFAATKLLVKQHMLSSRIVKESKGRKSAA